MKRIKYTAILLLLALLVSAGFSCSKKPETKSNFTPVPYTANTTPPSSADQTAEIKGEPGKPQTVDIFSGKPFNKSVYTDYNGERIYFCCNVEKDKFLKNPEMNWKKIKDRGILLDAASNTPPTPPSGVGQTAEVKGEPGKPQTVDIFSGKPVNKSVYTDYNGKRIYFCCDTEKGEFLKNPEMNMKRIKDAGVVLDVVPK
jgi:YHS domain-containing protein